MKADDIEGMLEDLFFLGVWEPEVIIET